MRTKKKLNLPADLRRSPVLHKLSQLSGEPIYVCLGRVLIALDHFASVSRRRKHTVWEINVAVEWYRNDPYYAELLEAVGFGKIDGDTFTVKMPYNWGWESPRKIGGVIRARQAVRGPDGRYLKSAPVSRGNADGSAL